jgi:hypothetical protein
LGGACTLPQVVAPPPTTSRGVDSGPRVSVKRDPTHHVRVTEAEVARSIHTTRGPKRAHMNNYGKMVRCGGRIGPYMTTPPSMRGPAALAWAAGGLAVRYLICDITRAETRPHEMPRKQGYDATVGVAPQASHPHVATPPPAEWPPAWLRAAGQHTHGTRWYWCRKIGGAGRVVDDV